MIDPVLRAKAKARERRARERFRRQVRRAEERKRRLYEIVRFEVRMTPVLRQAISEAAAAVFPGSDRQDSELVRTVVNEGLGYSSAYSIQVVRRVSKWVEETGGPAIDGADGGRRTASFYLKMRALDPERLKAAAAATRPESSKKQPSGSNVVRELLRQAFGMGSRDEGVTLTRLAAWSRDKAG